jgi:nucleotide-binding universal stress UspA family protein
MSSRPPAITRILCPVDLSDISARALSYAVTLAAQHQARVYVLEVVQTMLPPAAGGPQLFAMPAHLERVERHDLAAFVQPAAAVGVLADVRLREGDTVRQILHEAESIDADLIVLGTHGRSGFERLTLGSVAEKVLRRAARPVLAVPPGDRHPPDRPFRLIVCPTDFSEASTTAAGYARFIASGSTAELLFMTAVEWPFGDTRGTDAVSELRRSLEAEARDQLAALAGGAPRTRTVVTTGKPSREIVELASRQAADLIVMGVTGRGAVDLAVLGSTTQQVLRTAPCPVLTVPMAPPQ